MKFLHSSSGQSISSLNASLLFRAPTEINRDLIDALKTTDEEKDSKSRIQQSKNTAIQALGTFNAETIADIDAASGPSMLESIRGNRSVEALRTNVQNRVLGVLRGGDMHANDTVQYQALINDLNSNAETAALSVDSVERATLTLQTLRDNYERAYDQHVNNAQATLDNANYSFWQRTIGSKDRAQRELDKFQVRAETVSEIFGDLDARLQEKSQSAASLIANETSRIQDEFETALNIEQKRDLFNNITRDLTNPRFDIRTAGNVEQMLFVGLEKGQRMEIYRELGWDNRSIDQVLRETAQYENQGIRDKAEQKRGALDRTLRNINLTTLKTNLAVDPTEITPNDDFTGLLNELRPFVDQNGTKNRAAVFTGFGNYDSLNEYQEFAAYLAFLTKNKAITDVMPKDLKLQLANCIAFVEAQEGLESDDSAVSKAVEDFEKDQVDKHFKKAEKLFKTGAAPEFTSGKGLDSIKNLSDLDPAVFTDIDTFLTDQMDFESDIRSLINTSSDTEKTLLNTYLTQTEEFKAVITDLRKKWDTAQKERAQKELAFTKLETELAPLSKGATAGAKDVFTINGKSYKLPVISTSKTKGAIPKAKSESQAAERAAAQQSIKELIAAELPATTASPIDELKATDIRSLEIKLTKVNENITARTAAASGPSKARFDLFLKNQSAKLDNQELLEDMEANKAKQLELLKKRPQGSTIDLYFQHYQHGNPPTSEDLIKRSNVKQRGNLTIVETTNTGVVLANSSGTELLFIQESDSANGQIEVIGLPVDNIFANGIPANFDPSANYSFIGNPVTMMPR